MSSAIVEVARRDPSRPVPHDLPYRICARCGFPIPADDLIDSDFRPLHFSSCADEPA
jgi:hypothetical protein